MNKLQMHKDKRRNWIFCIVVGLLCIALGYLPSGYPARMPANSTRERVKVLSVDNANLAPLGVVYSGAQEVGIEILSGKWKGSEMNAANTLNSALEKDKLFAAGDEGLAIIHADEDGPTSATMVDHYRLGNEGMLFALFGLLLILFGGVAGAGALVSLVASVMVVWKLLIPALLKGDSPIPVALGVVLLLTALIMFLVAGFTPKALCALIGSLLGTFVTCLLATGFGALLKLDGSNLPYVVPLLSQSAMQLDIREIFLAMVFIANSGSLMDLAMDVSASCQEVCVHHPEITRRELVRSGFSVGRSVIGTMTTTLMLAYSGSYLSMMMYFMGQGTPVVDILNFKYVACEVLTTLVGSFGLVSVAPFTALIAGFVMPRQQAADKGALPEVR